jgi:hypothetical protein
LNSALRGGGGADEGVLLERLEREPAELRREPATLRGGALADGSPYRGAGGPGVRGAVIDVHGEDEEGDIGDDEERHEEREPPPERAEHGRRRRRRAAPVRAVAAVVSRAVAPVALPLGPLLASSFAAGRVNGDHRRLAPPRHGAAGGGGRGRVAGWTWVAARRVRARGAGFCGSGGSLARVASWWRWCGGGRTDAVATSEGKDAEGE